MIPLLEVVGNADKVAPEQIAAIGLNVGAIWFVITISIVTTAAH